MSWGGYGRAGSKVVGCLVVFVVQREVVSSAELFLPFLV